MFYIVLSQARNKHDKTQGSTNMGVSENSVPLNPMVNDHYPY